MEVITFDKLQDFIKDGKSYREVSIEDCLNCMEYEQIPSFIKMLKTKVRQQGSLVIKAMDKTLLAKHILSGKVADVQFSKLISNVKSMFDRELVINLLLDNGFSLVHTNIDYVYYELTLRRVL